MVSENLTKVKKSLALARFPRTVRGMSVRKSNECLDSSWLSPDEAGARIPGGLGGAAIRVWCRDGKLPGAIRLPSGRWRIPVSAVEAIIAGEAAA